MLKPKEENMKSKLVKAILLVLAASLIGLTSVTLAMVKQDPEAKCVDAGTKVICTRGK
jgi:hypothetical protein